MTPCDYFDLSVLVLILLGTVWGGMKGFISSLAILLATLVGIYAARNFKDAALGFLGLEPVGFMNGLAYFVLFALASMLVYQIMHAVEVFIRKKHLNAWNRILGFVLGCVLSLFACWLLAWFLSGYEPSRMAVTHSRSAKYLVLLAEFGKEPFTGDSEEGGEAAPSRISTISQTFIERVQQDAEIPRTEEETDGNARVHDFLDSVDEHVSEILGPQEKKEESPMRVSP